MEELVIFDDNEFLARMRDTAEPYLMGTAGRRVVYPSPGGKTPRGVISRGRE